MPGSYLVYVYRSRSFTPEPDDSTTRPDNLLIPPVYINQLGWTKGYFLPVGSADVDAEDMLPQHCFRDSRGRFLDEAGNVHAYAVEPCGEWGMGNHRTLDDQISRALALPPAPPDQVTV